MTVAAINGEVIKGSIRKRATALRQRVFSHVHSFSYDPQAVKFFRLDGYPPEKQINSLVTIREILDTYIKNPQQWKVPHQFPPEFKFIEHELVNFLAAAENRTIFVVSPEKNQVNSPLSISRYPGTAPFTTEVYEKAPIGIFHNLDFQVINILSGYEELFSKIEARCEPHDVHVKPSVIFEAIFVIWKLYVQN